MLPRQVKEDQDPQAWPAVPISMLRWGWCALGRVRERNIPDGMQSQWEKCPLLHLVNAAEAAAFSSQTKCRLALCHRHLLNYFLRQGQSEIQSDGLQSHCLNHSSFSIAQLHHLLLPLFLHDRAVTGKMYFVKRKRPYCAAACFPYFWITGVFKILLLSDSIIPY